MEESLLLPKVTGEAKRRSVTPSLTWATFTVELKRLGFLAGPMVTVTLSQYLLQVISMMMVGHLGELALSSTAIAMSLSGVTGFSLLVSLSFYPLYIFVFVLAYSICFFLGVKSLTLPCKTSNFYLSEFLFDSFSVI